ncbi:hypothetical protein [Streptomyces sp. WAC00263]|uniref:hypothetical protein n=1 Tax=Streptomyces sp. WAC00263 TaxID=1917422 RepID=UPI0015EF9561|nr:hypothetical protein [Streptomyces sp. WAC00263]
MLDATGLIVRPVGEHGEALGTWDFTDAAGPESFRRELVVLFARYGRARWTSESSYETSARVGRKFLRDAAAAEPPITAVDQISVAWWKSWNQGVSGRRNFRSVLQASDRLPEATRAYMATPRRRPVTVRRSVGAKRAHSKAELKMVRDAAAATVRSARLRIEENVALVERWRAGELAEGSREWPWGQLLDHVSRTGDVPRLGGKARNASRAARRLMGEEGLSGTLARLFPTVQEIAAASLLLIIHEGWNLSVLQKMQVPAFWPNADGDSTAPAIHRVATDKARRGKRRRHASNNLADVGEGSSGWAMKQVLDLTRQARLTLEGLGRPSSLLLLARRGRGGAEHLGCLRAGSALERAIWDWVDSQRAAGVRLPPRTSAQPLRHSAQIHHGRARNNTAATHAKDYLFKDDKVREDSRDLVESGLTKAVEHARQRVEMRLVAHATGDTDYDADQVAKAVGVDRDTARQIVGGRLKTPVASCTDFDHSDFSPPGKSCAVSFLLCFACRNAVATGRDLPRIVYLHQVIEGLRSTLTAPAWAADWQGHHARLGDFLNTHTSAETRAAYLSTLTEGDRHLIDRMLDRRLDP